MKDNNKIVMLPRSIIYPHPDNPRKDLGDISELRESIREHGIMQNLTIDGFRIKEEWKPVLDGTSELYIKEDE